MPDLNENWNCPYCGHAQVLNEKRVRQGWMRQRLEGWKHGMPAMHTLFIVCANDDCRELFLEATVAPFEDTAGNSFTVHAPVGHWKLFPPSSAKPQPDFIPQPIRKDYFEACAIRALSPKASATLIRRCLQGMIRDFCGISKSRLIDEIKELRTRVDDGKAPAGVQHDTVDAIDHVRGIGNIGAHMEADINVIVDVDPDEAQTLIELTELLFDEWYIARDVRAKRLQHLKSIADAKKSQKTLPSKE
ncbi:DUF4145 domain-containing protein [Bradyrhizobium sp. Arg68]|uniref:DUF4145 domain-containing protein n=1 Tax=Bradyrhizobium ivorense TaxID=2511166 RepID=UPI001E629446|nr:DUF4145 domain-containing protein [Bradyrhizobium ivorense]MCC8936882.1 DUF4145 domain-containing protein [Bradyrhizobium ivorense]